MLVANTPVRTITASATSSQSSLPEETANGSLELHVGVKTAAQFLGVSPSLVYAYVARKEIPHYRMMGRTIRFLLSELATWRQQFHINEGMHE